MPGSHSKKDKLKKKIAKKSIRNKGINWEEHGDYSTDESGVDRWVCKHCGKDEPLDVSTDIIPHIEEMHGDKLQQAKLKKRIAKVRKAGLGKKDYEEERKEYEKSIHRKPHKRDLKHSPPVRESNPRTPLKKEVPFGIKNDLGKESKDTTEKMRQMIRHNVKGKKIRPPKPTQKQRARIIKAKLSKIRKADQQDINRVKRWDSRSFNKKKELSGPTEPVFKPTAAIKPLTSRPQPGVRGDELMAKLRQRLAKIRKANGGIAPNYNNPSKVRKKKTATKAAQGSPGLQSSGPSEKPDWRGMRSMRVQHENLDTGGITIPQIQKNRRDFDSEIRSQIEADAQAGQLGKWLPKDLQPRPNKKTKTAARSPVNKAVNKVNIIKPTKAYKKPPQGPNPDARTPTAIRKNAEVVGRDNASYIGKTIKEGGYSLKERKNLKKKNPKPKNTKPYKLTLTDQIRSINRFKNRPKKPTQQDRINVLEARNKIARIRKAGEQIDPRVKKRKTVRPDSPVQKVSQMKDRIAEMKTANDHKHSIVFKKHEGMYYRRASLQKQEGKYAKYWLLNAKQTNGNGWGVSPTSIAKNINKFIGRPFVVTAKQWIPESEYGEQFEHPYLPTNNIDNIISHQEKFRVGSIVDVVEKDGDYHAVIEINSKFANMMLPPFCSPAIFQNNPGEADGEISDWEALHLAGLMEDPAYGARIALLKGSCMGTAEACSIQFKAAKQTTMCPKKKGKLVRRINRLGD